MTGQPYSGSCTLSIHNATLIIAKLDRLARNVAFISNLMESKVDFTAVDFPTANRLTIHVLAAVAEHEAAMISARTKAALAAAKDRGVRLGNPHSDIRKEAAKGNKLSIAARRQTAAKRVSISCPSSRRSKRMGRHRYERLPAFSMNVRFPRHVVDRGQRCR